MLIWAPFSRWISQLCNFFSYQCCNYLGDLKYIDTWSVYIYVYMHIDIHNQQQFRFYTSNNWRSRHEVTQICLHVYRLLIKIDSVMLGSNCWQLLLITNRERIFMPHLIHLMVNYSLLSTNVQPPSLHQV